MITQLKGTLIYKKPPVLALDVQQVGYEIHAPMSTFYHLPEIGQQVTILTHLSIREDAHILFGFLEERERQLFRILIKVNGVGPKLALTILSGIETEKFISCIQSEDITRLTKIPGVGKKTAERLMVELQDALSKWELSTQNSLSTAALDPNQVMQDALSALLALGYKLHEAKQMIVKVQEPHHNNEQVIRLALQQMVK